MDYTSLIKEINIPELVKVLRCCAGKATPGTKCPYYGEYWCGEKCLDKRLKEAADAIEALMDGEKTYLAELAQCHENLRRAAETIRERDERIEALQAELDQWKAAVKGQEDGIKVLQAEVERLKADVDDAYAH